VIVDSAAKFLPDLLDVAGKNLKEAPSLLVFSANTQDSLRRLVNNYQEYLQLHPERLSDLSYTLALRREHLPYRAYSVVGGESVSISPFAKVSGSLSGVTMIFSGQGAQWPGMSKDLIETDSAFREDIMAMDDILQSLKHPPNWRIESKFSL
jgi:acyl transferase domain-containing protein